MFPYILGFYGFASVMTYLAYGWDKRRAVLGGRRIAEQTLHWMELIGGWPGAMVAQHRFHHKWRKTSYMLIFWAIVFLHAAVWVLWIWHH